MFGKRKPIRDWPAERIREQVVQAWVDADGIQAAAILHVPDDLVPEAEVLSRGENEYFVYELTFFHDARIGLFLGGTAEDLIADRMDTDSLPAAQEEAELCVDDNAIRTDFDHLPGIYQWAILEAVRGEPIDMPSGALMWVLPDGHPKGEGVEQFPPRLEPPSDQSV